ncbi:hypothetical protein ABT095_11130 [Kitasatospora sp. NPDC002227]|uniref:hypothetical protein n=1 Tax=Kitasatospora sp. NPDC002227 TaxID=3154773 RepID=UPI00331779FB
MVAALAVRPADTEPAGPAAERPSLTELAARGPEELMARLHRAFPGEEPGAVAVAAFNSSI